MWSVHPFYVGIKDTKSLQTSSKPIRMENNRPYQVRRPRFGEVYAALKDIPNLDRADFQRALWVFFRHDCLFKTLMMLRPELRKDWLLTQLEWQ
jgi:hypothetical protein